MLLPTHIPTRLHALLDTELLCSELSRRSKPASGKYSSEQLRTVGRPAYLSQDSGKEYERSALAENSGQWRRFEALYSEVFGVLARFLGEVVLMSGRAAIPGFHIIRNSANFPRYEGGVPHVDSSYLHVPAFVGEQLGRDQYSFTLLLSRENDNVGLEYWAPGTTEADAILQAPLAFVPYCRGNLVIFDSRLVHRIAPFSSELERVTLQGHIIRLEGRLVAFW
ncbi:hypothetical protein [Pseudomonas wadenswilerensis]|uniref:hypothetical protein n=1 Tax=Pseudomonas wadenswilerensis TaxID=1785161 RepID=UPI0011E596F8|nr:hypothetical protein [Pseudomonas wadenswilerensis]